MRMMNFKKRRVRVILGKRNGSKRNKKFANLNPVLKTQNDDSSLIFDQLVSQTGILMPCRSFYLILKSTCSC